MAYLITCAGSKKVPTAKSVSSLTELSYSELLLDARREILELSEVSLNWDYTLPAWQLYTGNMSKLYPQVAPGNWTKPLVQVKILSALFGWISHTDLIPTYNLRMSDRRGIDNKQIWRIWYKKDVLGQLVEPTDIDLLSQDYRRAIMGKAKSVAIVPPVQFTDYGIQKGKWLNSQLDNVSSI